MNPELLVAIITSLAKADFSRNNGFAMAKSPNLSSSEPLRITISAQSLSLLEDLARRGIYGRNAAEVAARFIDQALAGFVGKPVLKVSLRPVQTARRNGTRKGTS